MTWCDYPAGFVDPRVEFWDVLVELGEWVQEISKLIPESMYFKGKNWSVSWLKAINRLKQLAQKELNQQPFSDKESAWIKKTIHKYYRSGSGGGWKWDGWYCGLFMNSREESEVFDPIIADIHTAPPSPNFGFSGTVLSEAVGAVNMMVAAVDNGNDVTMYAGPVYSHFEIIPDGIKRFSDSNWKEALKTNRHLTDTEVNYPEWAMKYVVVSQAQVNDDARVNK